jgi:hypothetical protein
MILSEGKASRSFLKKRTKKLLSMGPAAMLQAWAELTEVFLLLFFQKKQCLPALSLLCPRRET